jgi:adenylate cyclase
MPVDHESGDSVFSEQWRMFLTGYAPEHHRKRIMFSLLPSEHRCRFCKAPFSGVSGTIVKKLFRKTPSKINNKFCNVCDDFVSSSIGGAEVQASLLFADVRGSTELAERVGPTEFTQVMNRFYEVAIQALVQTDGWLDKLVGDEVMGIYLPGFAGPRYTRRAVEAAKELLRLTGHGDGKEPWLDVGAGVHSGIPFIGSVGTKDGYKTMTALGDDVNIAARLCSLAQPGEILMSEAAYRSAGLKDENLEKRVVELKGREEPVTVRSLRL